MIRSTIAVYCLLAVFAAEAARADRRPPAEPPSATPPAGRDQAPLEATVPLKIKNDAKAETHKVIIPKKFLAGLKVSHTDQRSASNRTMIAGLLMSLAVGAAVVIGVRTRTTRHAALVLVAGFALAGSTAWADFRLDPEPKREKPKQHLSISIEVVENGDEVTLIIPGNRR